MRTLLFATCIAAGLIAFAPCLDSQTANADSDTPRALKQNALSELESIEVDDRKDQKMIERAKNEIRKGLEDRLWEDDSSLTFLGKKTFSGDKKAIHDLAKVRSADVSGIAGSLILADAALAQLAVDLIPTGTDDDRTNKNLDKSVEEMRQAERYVDRNELDKAVDHYRKAWSIAFMGDGVDVVDADSASLDFSNDLITDYYVELNYSGDSKKPAKISYKIQDECVDLGPKDPSDVGGDTYDDAAMKIGVSTVSREWLTDGMLVWNDWFEKKNNDGNRLVDLVFSPVRSLPHFEDLGGDNVIQGGKKKNSFEHAESVPQLGGQSGWEGFVYFDASPGDYLFWTVHPAGGIDGCDRLAALGILVTIP